MITGAIVGFLIGYYVQERITGRNYGAGRWQRASDKKMVSDPKGFIYWIATPLLTAAFGAAISTPLEVALVGILVSLTPLAILGMIAAVIGGLYLFYKTHILGRPPI